jgi:hypothetical protein
MNKLADISAFVQQQWMAAVSWYMKSVLIQQKTSRATRELTRMGLAGPDDVDS